MKKSRIFLVEDHPVFRLGLRELLQQEESLEVCGEADDIPGAAAAIPRLAPDLAVVDLSLKGRNGIDLIKSLREESPQLRILVVSMHDEAVFAERALTAGARGYVMKQETSECIVKAVRSVLDGRLYLSEKLMGQLIDKFVGVGSSSERSPLERLTDRELEVFQLIGRGVSTGDIASRLNLSVKTIGTYRERIKEKLHLKTAGELILEAVKRAAAG